MRILPFCAAMLLCLCTLYSNAQNADTAIAAINNIPADYYGKIDKKMNNVSDQLTKKSLKYLAKFERQEKKIQAKLAKLNPESTATLLSSADEKYNELTQKIKSKTDIVGQIFSGVYNPTLDSVGTSLSFLKQFNGISGKVEEPLKSFDALQGKLQGADNIKQFIAERKNQIKGLLSKYTWLPAGLKGEYDKLNKTAYYYQAQILEYKEMLKDPDKMEKKALGILSKLPAFQKFMKQNSQLAAMFPQPDANSAIAGLAGLQTRSSIQAIVQQRVASGGPNAMAEIKANLAAGYDQFNKLKDKLNALGGGSGSGDLQMPDFKPNNQKTKSFLKRLEYSADMQFNQSSKLLPFGINTGLGIGYKLNDKSTAGIGISYAAGFGTIQHISFTSQAIGLRSYMDWKIKKQIYITGGYEMNYNTSFKNIEQLRDYNAWQRSALIGISKKYQVSKKVKGEMKILYDFLANTHIPVSQPILFRIGYNF